MGLESTSPRGLTPNNAACALLEKPSLDKTSAQQSPIHKSPSYTCELNRISDAQPASLQDMQPSHKKLDSVFVTPQKSPLNEVAHACASPVNLAQLESVSVNSAEHRKTFAADYAHQNAKPAEALKNFEFLGQDSFKDLLQQQQQFIQAEYEIYDKILELSPVSYSNEMQQLATDKTHWLDKCAELHNQQNETISEVYGQFPTALKPAKQLADAQLDIVQHFPAAKRPSADHLKSKPAKTLHSIKWQLHGLYDQLLTRRDQKVQAKQALNDYLNLKTAFNKTTPERATSNNFQKLLTAQKNLKLQGYADTLESSPHNFKTAVSTHADKSSALTRTINKQKSDSVQALMNGCESSQVKQRALKLINSKQAELVSPPLVEKKLTFAEAVVMADLKAQLKTHNTAVEDIKRSAGSFAHKLAHFRHQVKMPHTYTLHEGEAANLQTAKKNFNSSRQALQEVQKGIEIRQNSDHKTAAFVKAAQQVHTTFEKIALCEQSQASS